MNPERIFINGKVVTMDASSAITEAIAVANGRVTAVGSSEQILSLRRGKTEVIDLQGKLLLPGFTDCHTHFLSFSQMMADEKIDLLDATSKEETLELIRQRANTLKEDEWLLGRGWNQNRWHSPPTKEDLDAITQSRPVLLSSVDGHSIWVNSRALKIANVTVETPTPKGGEIERNAHGEPTGVLKETAAGLIRKHVPSPALADNCAAIKKGMAIAHSYGITGIHNFEGTDAFEAFEILAQRDSLTLRVLSGISASRLDAVLSLKLKTGFGGEFHRIGGLKLFCDGALGSHSAAMFEAYLGEPENKGILSVEKDRLLHLAKQASKGGISLAIHAIGDRANRIVLDILDEIDGNANCQFAMRHRIEHAQHLHPDDIPRFSKLGVIASVQPVHLPVDIDTAEKYLGEERCKTTYPFKSLLETGAHLCLGSDAPVASINPLEGISAAVNRTRFDGTPKGGWYPEQKLTVYEALSGYTIEAAYAAGQEDFSGSIEVGKAADFAILNENILTVPPEKIAAVKVDITVVGGNIVFER